MGSRAGRRPSLQAARPASVPVPLGAPRCIPDRTPRRGLTGYTPRSERGIPGPRPGPHYESATSGGSPRGTIGRSASSDPSPRPSSLLPDPPQRGTTPGRWGPPWGPGRAVARTLAAAVRDAVVGEGPGQDLEHVLPLAEGQRLLPPCARPRKRPHLPTVPPTRQAAHSQGPRCPLLPPRSDREGARAGASRERTVTWCLRRQRQRQQRAHADLTGLGLSDQ